MSQISQRHLSLPGIRTAYLEGGRGLPLVFLHGWPEWSAVYRKNLPVLAREFRVLAPDLRGFGDSEAQPATSVESYVEDLENFVDALGLGRFGLVSHDVGAFLAQDYARRHPERLAGLFFFDCPHFGLGRRWLEGGQLREIWYQSFHQLPLAIDLVGSSPAACRAYFGHFLRHWAHDKSAFDAVLDEWVAMFLRPGRLAGGFAWYKAANARRLEAMQKPAAAPAKITVPTRVLWGESDPILRAEWRDTLPEIFTDLTVELAPDAGHFVHWEQPALANQRIAAFFLQRG